MNLVSLDIIRLARLGDGHLTASFKWLGHRPEGPGADALGKDFTPFRMTASERVTEAVVGPDGTDGAGAWRCLPSISCKISGEGEARPLEVRALMALEYWPTCTARLALRMLWETDVIEEDACSERLDSERPSSKASDHRLAMSPSDHRWRRDFTRRRISRHLSLCPSAGLTSTHLASMKSRDHWLTSAGVLTTDDKQSPRMRAQRSLAPLGTCWRVGM